MTTMKIEEKPTTLDRGTQNRRIAGVRGRPHKGSRTDWDLCTRYSFFAFVTHSTENDNKRKREIIELDSDSEEESDGLDDVDKELQAGTEGDDDDDDDSEANRLIMFGRGFDKAQEYDHYLDEPNPWHEDLKKPLRTSQIIGFRWMLDRHVHGCGLVANIVGIGKVHTPPRA